MGEIGFPRREFLYVLQFWEIRRIIDGHRQRNRLQAELLRLCAYSSFFAMRENKTGTTPAQWMPLPWEKEAEPEEVPQEDVDELRDLMASMREKEK